jgi:hypothetical protein
MKVFTLYIGTRKSGAHEVISKTIGQRFGSFTVIEGEGHFNGTIEPMWFVRIGTKTPILVIETAEAIRRALDQESVGIEYSSRYYICSANDQASSLRALLKAET